MVVSGCSSQPAFINFSSGVTYDKCEASRIGLRVGASVTTCSSFPIQ
jgi:hypothetical protein